jgi:hypothetical protein
MKKFNLIQYGALASNKLPPVAARGLRSQVFGSYRNVFFTLKPPAGFERIHINKIDMD